MMTALISVTLIASASLTSTGRCDRGAPEPRAFHARGFEMVAELFPPDSRNNDSSSPVAHLYRMAYPGPRWEAKAEREWTTTLPHQDFPMAALVSMAGHMVTLDDHSNYGLDVGHAVVLVGADGGVRGDFSLTDLFTEAELEEFPVSDCGYDWREDARFFFLLDGEQRFYMLLAGGLVLEFDLDSGALRRGTEADFPELAATAAREHANEETQIWSITLRFASISDRMG